VTVAWLWGVRVARANARDGASDRTITSGTTASRRLWPPCRSPHRPGPVGRAPPGWCPRVSTCCSAFPRLRGLWSVIVVRRGPQVGIRWILGASAPRCVVVSVRSEPAA